MKEGVARILLVVAPSIMECYRTVQYFGIDLGEYAGQLRYISRPYSLIGWKRGTPFVTRDRDHWSTDTGIALDQALWALTRSGQLRIAGEHDLALLRPCLVAAALPKTPPVSRISQG
ncbi:hypothetical protein GOD47_23560 [Sinorhizobium medicae]|nr:hypothetical protein [Sinorhizobium medicae]MDX0727970.1 hypothetical protein [Sinorhizobium medicae]MDX0734263.1 hypothetical protein [Sinorhizobium medicae]MDX0814138.1 hypothetical protein [Sinorhizobium medicae]